MIRGDLAFRGTVVVAGLLIDPASLGEAEARRRVLAVARSGATVRATPHGYLVTTTERIAVQAALGAPVVAMSGVWTTVPLSPEEARAIAAPPGSLVVAVAGDLSAFDLANAPLVDASTWLDCTTYVVALLDRPPVRFAELRRERFAPPADPLRGVVPPDESAQGREARAAFEQARARAKKNAGAGATKHGSAEGAAAAAVATFVGFFAGLLSMIGVGLMALFSAASSAGSSSSSGKSDAPLAPREEARPGAFTRWSQALDRWASRLLLATRLGALIGKKHAQYFEEMMDAFARKDFDEALKRAVPLGQGGEDEDLFETMFGGLAKRDALTISPQLGRGGGRFGVSPVGYQRLRDLYRAAFQALDERGDIDRASFVLAELLRENAEAVAYLERHGRFRLAAELAEHRRLDTALVVRLWFLAGDAVRAVLLARRDNAFAAAVLAAERVEKDGGRPGAAGTTRGLRAVWMDTLAEAGDFEGAATVALADQELRPFARAFWRQARRTGGALAGRSLAQALLDGERADPASDEDITTSAERLLASRLADPDDLAGEEREAFVQMLAHADARAASTAASRIARLAARQLLAGRPSEASRGVIAGLLQVGGDALIAADLPPRVVRDDALPWRATLDGLASPGLVFSDVALLRGGRRLLAAGAHGVFLLDRRGRTLFRFDAPARSLVVSDAGTRALALSPTGEQRQRITRIDLVGRRAEPWTETAVEAFCRTFDGDTWLLADDRDLVLLDCLGDRPAPLGKLPFPRDPLADGPSTLCRERGAGSAVTVAVQRTYDETKRRSTLRRTQIVSFVLRGVRDFEVETRTSAGTEGRVEWLVADPSEGSWLARLVDGRSRGDVRPFLLPEGFVASWLRTEPRLTLIGGRQGDDALLLVIDGDDLRCLLEVRAKGATAIVASEPLDGRLAVADDRGRSGVFALPMVH